MAKEPREGIALAQNFLKSPNLARALVGVSSIEAEDIVCEIGAGRGILTAELARVARKVIALEIDPALVCDLRRRFRDVPQVEILEGDFLEYRIAEGRYKVFANIPFNRTAEIVRKILSAVPGPEEAYLVMQKQAAEKFSGRPKETRFSILAKPWYDLRVIRRLRRTDFAPVSGVDSVLLRIRKRSPPMIPEGEVSRYRQFVAFGFGGWKRSLKITLRRIFSYRQWKRLSKDLSFSLHATPTELTFEQWFGLFEEYRRGIPLSRRPGAEKINPGVEGAP